MRPAVTDFGIARLASEDTLTGTGRLLGTAAYLAPEQALGAPASDASDRYALAVVAFELLVGQRPFTAEHFGALARQQIADDPPRASSRRRSLPRAVDGVLARGMAKRPADRWTTAGTFVDALEAAFSQPGGARRIIAVAPPRRPRLAAAPRTTRSTPWRTTTYTAAPSTTIPAAPTTTSTARQAAPRPPTAAVLEARGHQLMLDGAYTAAIPDLRQAIAAATPDDVNYAYALFDLGRSLRLAGDPQAAIAVLQRRLQIPNQTPVVLSELRLAQRARAGRAPAAGAATPSPPRRHRIPPGHDHSLDGGAAITATDG
jgi:tetratricopeptide (TPR) repeat protein